MRFFYHKLGEQNKYVEKFLLHKDNPIKKSAIAVFWNSITIKEMTNPKISHNSKLQMTDFYSASLKKNRLNFRIVLIYRGRLIICQPIGNLIEKVVKTKSHKKELVKFIPVKIIKELSLSIVPHIIASMNANAYLRSGTFREISSFGNLLALYIILKEKLPDKRFSTTSTHQNLLNDYNNPDNKVLISCLSSLQLETLIAKIFESYGCFVSAYRGGNIEHIDLFAFNKGAKLINVNGIRIPKNKSISIQIKSKDIYKKPECVDYFIVLGTIESEMSNIFDANWIIQTIIKSENNTLKNWFQYSLDWLPKEFKNKFQIFN